MQSSSEGFNWFRTEIEFAWLKWHFRVIKQLRFFAHWQFATIPLFKQVLGYFSWGLPLGTHLNLQGWSFPLEVKVGTSRRKLAPGDKVVGTLEVLPLCATSVILKMWMCLSSGANTCLNKLPPYTYVPWRDSISRLKPPISSVAGGGANSCLKNWPRISWVSPRLMQNKSELVVTEPRDQETLLKVSL
jgi:hypothetical protein